MPRWGACARGMAQARALRPARLLTHLLTARATTLSVRTTDQGRSVERSDHGLGSKWLDGHIRWRPTAADPRCRTVRNGCKPLHAHSSCLGTTASGQHWGAPITVLVGEPTPSVPAHLRTSHAQRHLGTWGAICSRPRRQRMAHKDGRPRRPRGDRAPRGLSAANPAAPGPCTP